MVDLLLCDPCRSAAPVAGIHLGNQDRAMTFSNIGVSQIVWGIIFLVLFGGACVAVVSWFRAWQLSAQAWLADYQAGIVELLLLQRGRTSSRSSIPASSPGAKASS